MDKESDTKLNLNFFIDCEINVQLNRIKEATEELDLLKYWALNFDEMHPIIKNEVIRKINERAEKNKFYDCFALMLEVIE